MVSSTGMLVNKESISYETHSSSELKGFWFLIIDANVWVSLILYSFSHKGLRYDITLEALYVSAYLNKQKVAVWEGHYL